MAPTIVFTACPPESLDSTPVNLHDLPEEQNLAHSAEIVTQTLAAITESPRLHLEFNTSLNEIYIGHLEHGKQDEVNHNWRQVNWVNWLDEAAIHVNFTIALNPFTWGWMTREVQLGRKFSVLWELASAASYGPPPRPPPSPPPSLPHPTITFFNFLTITPPSPPPRINAPLPKKFFDFAVAVVSIHETFHLVNFRIFGDLGTPTTHKIPSGESGQGIETRLFGGRIAAEWLKGYEGDFRYLCGLYVETLQGLVPITEDDIDQFLEELLDEQAIRFSWNAGDRPALQHLDEGKVRTFGLDFKPPTKKAPLRKVHGLLPGRVWRPILERCHE
ncbi:hypothetical protein FA95DRAFT_1604143 [Auriscalpium vulgare]|uniref:Uncharacterized protein n=1 Tax=Auriscalpium vulgare TaxID=40419 RepID=A0ACB8S0P0_9AGAM|nr:hypothetical protein FA95DRAFT_1604143 [Auriscalpium vulgare]